MDIYRRLLGTSGITNEAHAVAGVDLNGIIRRLILFDTYILKSLGLQESPFLIAELGFSGTMQLLASPAFEIQCEVMAVGQTGQTAMPDRESRGILPPLSYALSGIRSAEPKKFIHDRLQPLHQIPNLTQKQIIKLKKAIVDTMVSLPEHFAGRVATDATADVLNKQYLVKKSVEMVIRQTHRVEPPKFSISVHAIGEGDIRVETDLMSRMNIDLPTAHKLVERGLLGLGSLSQRFAEMDAFSALSGFTESDLPLVDEQLKFFLRMSPETKEQQFRRVVEIAGLPDFTSAISERRVNVERLLEIRESAECREFRDWLPTIDGASDSEIKQRVGSLRARFGNATQSGGGKAVRVLAITGIGAIPAVGLIAGAVASVADTFFLEKIFPKSGVVAFLSDLYPSVFEEVK
jgi:hypothetical protein